MSERAVRTVFANLDIALDLVETLLRRTRPVGQKTAMSSAAETFRRGICMTCYVNERRVVIRQLQKTILAKDLSVE